MTENVDTTGTAGATNASDSSVGDSGLAARLQASLDSLNSKVDSFAKTVSTIQSGKDKAVQKVESELKSMFADYEKLKERLGPDGAVEQMELKQQLSDIQAQLQRFSPTVPAMSAGNTQTGADLAAKVIDQIGLPDAPEVASFRQRSFSSEAEALLEGAKLAASLAKKPLPSAAQLAATESKTVTAGAETVEELTRDYQKNMLAAKGNKSMLRSLKEEARKKGVPVDSIVFV